MLTSVSNLYNPSPENKNIPVNSSSINKISSGFFSKILSFLSAIISRNGLNTIYNSLKTLIVFLFKPVIFYLCILLYPFSLLFSESMDINKMSLEEKIGQILIVHFNGETPNQDAETLINSLHVSGICYYEWANGLINPQQVQKLSNDLQKMAEKTSHIPLFICTDQEGGKVARLHNGFTLFPGNSVLQKIDDPVLTYACAEAMAEEMQAVGVNFDLAPVVDITNEKSFLYKRSFGENPEKVIRHASAFLNGLKSKNVLSCLKHFPGYGSTEKDAHEDLPVVLKSKTLLQECDLQPYIQLKKIAPSIMTAHIKVYAYDKENCASLSPIILTDLLRKQIGYEGVVISDSLVMEAIVKTCLSFEEAAILAFNAGCDIILLGGKQLFGCNKDLEIKVEDVKRIALAIKTAVKTGRIAEDRLNASVERILKLKEKLTFSYPNEKDIQAKIMTPEHLELSKKLIQLSDQKSQ